MLVSGVQKSDSVIHIHVSILFQIIFLFRLLQNTEQSSLCYTVGPCRLSILKIAVCTLSVPNSQSIPPTHTSPLVTLNSFSKSVSLFLFCKSVHLAKKHMKSCSTLLIIRQMQTKTTIRYHLTPIRMAMIKKTHKQQMLERVWRE